MRTMRFTMLPTVALAFLVASTTETSATGKQIEGLWNVEVTILTGSVPRCGDPVPIPPIRSMIMFTRHGQIIETAGPLVGEAGFQRLSPGLGTWQRVGRRHYTAAFTFFRINVPPLPPPPPMVIPFSFAGTQTITEDIELSHDGNSFTATGTSQIVDANGAPRDATCNTLTGTRID
jgi:hypothetical protein